MSTTAQIAAKGCNDTGITEDLASRLHDQLGRKVLAIVELVAETRTENRKGDEKVGLSILTIEPAPNTMTEDHLRELARAFHYERQLADGQLRLESKDDIEPKVADVLAAGAAHRPHPFLPADASLDTPICDVCGHLETAPVHSTQDALPDPDDELDDDEESEDTYDDEDEDDDEPEQEQDGADVEQWETTTPDTVHDTDNVHTLPGGRNPFLTPAG